MMMHIKIKHREKTMMLVAVHLQTRSAGFSTQETMKILSVIFVNKNLIQNLISCYIQECSGIAQDARADDALIVENNKPNDDLALLVGIERLDQLFDLYYIDNVHTLQSRVCPTGCLLETDQNYALIAQARKQPKNWEIH